MKTVQFETFSNMNNIPKVSIVLVTYNRAHAILNTLRSISEQTMGNFECIIMDDCSTDQTPKVCKEWSVHDSRFRYYRQPNNLGMPLNMNIGILKCQGEFIVNMHDGDIYRQDALEQWLHVLEKYPSAAMAFNAYVGLDENGNESTYYIENLPEVMPGIKLIDEFFRRWLFDSPVWGTAMVRRSAYQELGLFCEDYRFFSDIEFWIRLAMHYDVCYIPEPLIHLPSRKVLPRLFKNDLWKDEWLVQQIFYECRRKVYSKEPLKLLFEIFKHNLFRVAKGLRYMLIFGRKRNWSQEIYAAQFIIGIPSKF